MVLMTTSTTTPYDYALVFVALLLIMLAAWITLLLAIPIQRLLGTVPHLTRQREAMRAAATGAKA